MKDTTRYSNKILTTIIIVMFSLLIIVGGPSCTYGQDNAKDDSTFVEISYGEPSEESSEFDTLSQYQDVNPLDIASDRGLFILSPDRMMQMRILGSVRVLINYGDQAMPEKLTFNPYEIPMRERIQTPNFYADVSLTRLGFEITRRTKKFGDLFIRIETDFAGKNGFRLRHAYGQLGRILIGKTWTLFSNGNYVPATVSRDGLAGSTVFFTPQIRYSRIINNTMSWQASIEYSTPEIKLPDSIDAQLVQVIPDVVGRYNYKGERLSFRFSALVTTISGTDTTNTISYSFGWAGSFSGIYILSPKDNLHFSVTSASAVSRFMDVFSGKNEDIAYNPNDQKFYGLVATGGFVAWSHIWPKNLSSSLSAGVAIITNRGFQDDNAYSHSFNALLNVFWQPVEGARMGIEYAGGERFNKGGGNGQANRFSILMYYDF